MYCSPTETVNRYGGRGSGDRIARLKELAIGVYNVPPVNKPASYVTSLKKACGCIGANCNINALITQGAYDPALDTYTLTSLSGADSPSFLLATIKASEVEPRCANTLAFDIYGDVASQIPGATVEYRTETNGDISVILLCGNPFYTTTTGGTIPVTTYVGIPGCSSVNKKRVQFVINFPAGYINSGASGSAFAVSTCARNDCELRIEYNGTYTNGSYVLNPISTSPQLRFLIATLKNSEIFSNYCRNAQQFDIDNIIPTTLTGASYTSIDLANTDKEIYVVFSSNAYSGQQKTVEVNVGLFDYNRSICSSFSPVKFTFNMP